MAAKENLTIRIENIASPDEYMSQDEVNRCINRLCKKYDCAFKELAK